MRGISDCLLEIAGNCFWNVIHCSAFDFFGCQVYGCMRNFVTQFSIEAYNFVQYENYILCRASTTEIWSYSFSRVQNSEAMRRTVTNRSNWNMQFLQYLLLRRRFCRLQFSAGISTQVPTKCLKSGDWTVHSRKNSWIPIGRLNTSERPL